MGHSLWDVVISTFTDPIFLFGVVLCVFATLAQNIGLGLMKLCHHKMDSKARHLRKAYYFNPWWWASMGLFMTGVFSDFVALGFLPASVALPLGGVGLVASGYFGHLMLGEKFTIRDKIGTGLVVVGAWTTVIFSEQNDYVNTAGDLMHKLFPNNSAFWYCMFCLICLVALIRAQFTGVKNAIVGTALPGTIGSFGNMGGKGTAELFRLTVGMGQFQFFHPFAWVYVIATGSCLVVQNHFLQQSLATYDQVIVVPIYYCTLVLFSCLGGVLFFYEFNGTTVLQDLIFLGGIGAIFLGVFFLMRDHLHSNRNVDEDDEADDASQASDYSGSSDNEFGERRIIPLQDITDTEQGPSDGTESVARDITDND